MRAVKKIFLILGIIGVPVSLFFLAGGVMLVSGGLDMDEEGFYDTWKFRIEKGSRAIVMVPESVGIPEVYDAPRVNEFKVEASAGDNSSQIFIGIAAEEDIAAYLDGVEYDEINDLFIFPTRVQYLNHPGESAPVEPTSQQFWTDFVFGAGTQTMTWEIEPDRPWLVLINRDSSAGLDFNVTVGSKAPLQFTTGTGNLFIGGIGLIFSLLMVTVAGRDRNIVYPEPIQRLPGQKKKASAGAEQG